MRCRGVSWLEAAVPSVCLVGLLVCPRITRKVPGPLLTPPALAIAMLGAIESLMSAVVSGIALCPSFQRLSPTPAPASPSAASAEGAVAPAVAAQ